MKCVFAVVAGTLPVMAFGLVWPFGLAQAQEGWELSGIVTSDSGPVKGAVVQISGTPYIPSARTDGRGSYSFKGMAPGRYSITVPSTDNASAPKSRTLSLAGGMRLKVDFRIPKGGVISGRVLDRDGQPVAGVIVQARSKTISLGRPRLKQQGGDLTNHLGEYRIPYLSEGAYVVAVTQRPLPIRTRASGPGKTQARGYAPITFYPNTRVPDAASVVEIRSGGEHTGLNIVLQKEATRCVSFKVGGGFQARAHATLEERLTGLAVAFAEGSVTANGSYEFCGLPPGEYRLHLGRSEIVGPQSRQTLQPLGYQMAIVNVGKEDVDIGTLEPLAQLDIPGTVAVKDGRPVDSFPAGVRVGIDASELQGLFTSRSEVVRPDGTFVLRQVFAGDYGVRVSGLPAGYYVIGATQQGRSVLDRGLWPGDGNLNLTLGADGPTVSGRVLDANGAAIPDAAVFLVPKQAGPHLVAQSDQTGSYQFSAGVQPGEYRLAAASDVGEWQLQDVMTATRLAANGMELKLGTRESRALDLRIPPAP